MKLPVEQVSKHLKNGLAPIYLISGDEPLQVQEVSDAIRKEAKEQGFDERDVLHVDSDFRWSDLKSVSSNLSLFSQKRLIDLRLGSAKTGREGSAALVAYCDNLDPDTLLLIQCAKLDKSQTQSKWVKTIEKAGVFVQAWPLDLAKTQAWIKKRLRSYKLQADDDVIHWLAMMVEGNLLAAHQEVEKLALLFPEGHLSIEQMMDAVEDNSRYTTFVLADAVLLGDVDRAIRILQNLRLEGVNEIQILWALSKDIQTITWFRALAAKRENTQIALSGVWPSRRSLIERAANRHPYPAWKSLTMACARLDALLKGARRQCNSWDELLQLVTAVARKPALPVRLMNKY